MQKNEQRARIAQKAELLFMQYGIRSVSMSDIASNLGMSKKTLYQYFADKDELVDAVVETHIGGIQVKCLGCAEEAQNAVEEIFLTMDRIMEEIGNMNPMLLYDLEKFHFRAYRRFREHKDRFLLEVVKKNLLRGIQDELYRSDLDVEVLSRFRIESMMIPFNVEVFPPAKFSLAKTAQVVIEHFIYGLVTVKGHKLIQKYEEQRRKKHGYENKP